MGLLARLLPPAIRQLLLRSLGDSSEGKFAHAFHASPDWIVITRLSDGLIIDANEGFHTISGYDPKDVIGQPMTRYKVWVHVEQRQQLVDEMTRHGAARDRLVQLRRSDGSVRDCMVNCALLNLHGRGHDHAVWIARDVTEQHAIHEQFRAAFKLTPDVMSISRLSDGCYIEVNDAFERVLGRSRADTIGRTSIELNVWHELAQRDALVAQLQTHDSVSGYFMLLNASGGRVREALLDVATFEARGERCLISLVRDVTEERRVRQQIQELNAGLELRVAERTADLQHANRELSQTLASLQQAQRQLVQSEKLAALGALVAGVAHELNTPIGNGLTVASTFEHRVQELAARVQAGIRRSELNQFLVDAQQGADILLRNLTRASELIHSFKQVSVDRTSSQRRRFQLAELVAEILTTLSPSMRKSACKVERDIDPGLVMDSYPGPLGQVLTNLVNNAMLHAFGEGEAGSIVIQARALDEARLLLEFSDNGRGIKTEDLNHVFEPFFTTRLGQGGSGLGLHIAHNLVSHVLGGSIEVHSAPGQGARFTLTLPLCAPGAAPEGLPP